MPRSRGRTEDCCSFLDRDTARYSPIRHTQSSNGSTTTAAAAIMTIRVSRRCGKEQIAKQAYHHVHKLPHTTHNNGQTGVEGAEQARQERTAGAMPLSTLSFRRSRDTVTFAFTVHNSNNHKRQAPVFGIANAVMWNDEGKGDNLDAGGKSGDWKRWAASESYR